VLRDTSGMAALMHVPRGSPLYGYFGMKTRAFHPALSTLAHRSVARLERREEPQPLLARLLPMKYSSAPDFLDAKLLSAFGNGEVGYIKPICNETDYIKSFFPEIKYAHGMELFALYSADGMPLMISASLAAAKQNARAHCLATVTIH
jgi:hypothetical protein